MSKCTAAQAVAAAEYWLGYYEKASSSYAQTRAKSAFALNKGSANYTYFGYLWGIQGGAWCAMLVTTAIYEACGSNKTDAKAVLHDVLPYTACNQLYDAAPAASKGRRGAWTPKAGDIIVFTDNGTTRTHTGIVYYVSGKYVYTIEGNSANMCRKRSYLLTSSYIYGYVRPAYAAETESVTTDVEQYGKAVAPTLHLLSKGCAGPEVESLQLLLNHRASQSTFNLSEPLKIDGDFGAKTEAAVQAFKDAIWPSYAPNNGKVGQGTWEKLIG